MPANASTASRKAPAKKKSRTADISSPETAQIEYLTTELNYAQSKIVSQDSSIKDLELKVKILTQKLKISEEKLNSDMHTKYFGESSQNQGQPSCCGAGPHTFASHSHSSCRGSCRMNTCFPLPGQVSFNLQEMNNLCKEVGDIKLDILEIKSMLASSNIDTDLTNTNLCDQDPSQTVSAQVKKTGTAPIQQQETVSATSGTPPRNIHPCSPALSTPASKQPENMDQIEVLVDVHDIPGEISVASMDEGLEEDNENLSSREMHSCHPSSTVAPLLQLN